MIQFRCTQLSYDQLLEFENEKRLPTLSSLMAAKPEIRAELENLTEHIVAFNKNDESDHLAQIIRISNHLIDNNLMFYAKASKIELIVLIAMCTQRLGGSYKEAFDEVLNNAFPNKL